MALGYDGKLYILAFDHRGSFQKKMFGIEGDPSPEETARIADAKRLIFEGMLEAVNRGADRHPLVAGGLDHLPPQPPQLLLGLLDAFARVGRDLEHRLHQLGLDLADLGGLEQRFDRADELERRAVEDHQFLFDANRVGRACEPVLHGVGA